MKVKFTFLTGDVNYLDHGAKWITTQSFMDGSHPVWGVVELHPVEDNREFNCKYYVNVSVVSPSQASRDTIKSATESWGLDQLWEEMDEALKVDVIHSYIGGAPVAELQGNNFQQLMKDARQELEDFFSRWDVCISKPKNKLMANGKDFLKGNRGPSPAQLGKALWKGAYPDASTESLAIWMTSQENT